MVYYSKVNQIKGVGIMNSFEIKRILIVIDKIENEFTSIEELESTLQADSELGLSHHEIHELLEYLIHHNYLLIKDTLDLCSPITLYARSKTHSLCESICLLECLLQDPKFLKFYQEYRNKTFSRKTLNEILSSHNVIRKSIQRSKIFIPLQSIYAFNNEMTKAADLIIEEQKEPSYIISSIAYTHFIASTINYQDLPLRNCDQEIIKYPHQDYIFKYLPQRGIPQNRSLSESLQNFYKDTLMQEYQHQCPICNIHIPHMLIASHIKPFRDCAHLIESSDHNNGILLCKNHDFLFDQGYISFKDNGNILISQELTEEDYKAMHLSPNYVLPRYLMTKRRRLFLQYHRQNYFRG